MTAVTNGNAKVARKKLSSATPKHQSDYFPHIAQGWLDKASSAKVLPTPGCCPIPLCTIKVTEGLIQGNGNPMQLNVELQIVQIATADEDFEYQLQLAVPKTTISAAQVLDVAGRPIINHDLEGIIAIGFLVAVRFSQTAPVPHPQGILDLKSIGAPDIYGVMAKALFAQQQEIQKLQPVVVEADDRVEVELTPWLGGEEEIENY